MNHKLTRYLSSKGNEHRVWSQSFLVRSRNLIAKTLQTSMHWKEIARMFFFYIQHLNQFHLQITAKTMNKSQAAVEPAAIRKFDPDEQHITNCLHKHFCVCKIQPPTKLTSLNSNFRVNPASFRQLSTIENCTSGFYSICDFIFFHAVCSSILTAAP